MQTGFFVSWYPQITKAVSLSSFTRRSLSHLAFFDEIDFCLDEFWSAWAGNVARTTNQNAESVVFSTWVLCTGFDESGWIDFQNVRKFVVIFFDEFRDV